jgi:recombination protein RecA
MAKAKKAAADEGFSIKSLAEYGDIEFITSGIEEIDAITPFPRGRITEIFGLQGVGKSELVQMCLTNMSKEGKVLYIDAENALNPSRLLAKGGEAKNIIISDMCILEDVAKLTVDSVSKYDVIVVDSIATLVTKAEAEGETGDQFVGLKARLMGQWMRKLIGPLGKSKCAVVFINQLREGMSMFTPVFKPGGKALPYASSLSLYLTANKSDRIVKDGVAVGHWVNVEFTKSRVCPPHQKTKFKLMY